MRVPRNAVEARGQPAHKVGVGRKGRALLPGQSLVNCVVDLAPYILQVKVLSNPSLSD